jgi:16S rRNA (guanine527-N7)-methyltransferase
LRSEVIKQVERLVARYELAPGAVESLSCVLRSATADPHAPTAVRDPELAVDAHLADSLVALTLPAVTGASRVVDIGAGAGFPGLPLAVARPEASFVLLESAGRKCDFLSHVIESCGIANVAVVHSRAEEWREGLGRFELATARAVAAPSVLLEYAAPLLSIGGVLVAWRGQRDLESESAADRAAEELGMEPATVIPVAPYSSAEHRHLHLWSKVRDTPERFPRRAGMALKRPLGGSQPRSDRKQR